MDRANGWGRWVGFGLVLSVWLAAPALALEARTVRDIERADTLEKLADLADEITRDAAARKVTDPAVGTLIAAETNSYLLYILTKQNTLLLRHELADPN